MLRPHGLMERMAWHLDDAIRVALPVDCEAIRSCVRAAYARYVERIGREPAPMSADYAALIARGGVYVLVEPLHRDEIRGVLVVRPDSQTLWIENVAVHPHYQHRGHGRRLMHFAERLARTQVCAEIRLYTNELMVENIALYTRLGYIEEDRRVDDGFRRVFMRKGLAVSQSTEPS